MDTAKIEPEKIKGFEQLPAAWAEIFKAFITNFYNGWGMAARSTIVPISVRAKKDKSNGAYLRFEYKIYDRDPTWLHVKNAWTWY